MCGIIGFIDKEVYRKNFTAMFDTLKHRGTDSYGFIQEETAKTHTEKALFLPSLVTKLESKPKANFILAHNRKTSVGGTTLPLAHPITSSDKKVTVIHNGTKKSLFNAILDSDSDTEAIAEILSLAFEPSDLISELLDGCGVVFAKNLKTGKVLFHSDGERPLFIHESKEVFASEPVGIGKWKLVKPQLKVFDSLVSFIQEVETYPTAVELKKGDMLKSSYCTACKKIHIHVGSSNRCTICEVLDITPPVVKTYSYVTPTYVVGTSYEMSNDSFIWYKKTLTARVWDPLIRDWTYHAGTTIFKHIRKLGTKLIPELNKSYTFQTSDGKYLQGKLIAIVGTSYTLAVTTEDSFVASKLIKEIEDHPILESGKSYLFWDEYINASPKELVFNSLSYKKDSKLIFTTSQGSFQRVKALITGKLKLIKNEKSEEWVWGTITRTLATNKYFYKDAFSGAEKLATDHKPLEIVFKDEFLEVSNNNKDWNYAIANENITNDFTKGIMAVEYDDDSVGTNYKYFRIFS